MRFKRFPLFWLIACASVVLFVQLGDRDQDIKNTVLMFSIGAFFFGSSIWSLFFSKMPRRQRLAIGLIPWVVAIAFFSTIELVNNGDVSFVGWQWRWASKPDQLLRATSDDNKLIENFVTTSHDYPKFLGNGYWAEVPNVNLETDWNKNPPKERWRCEVGAGWSGFAIVGDYAWTQEQRGDQEMVVCYRVDTSNPHGEIIWAHADDVRFDPGGAGALGGIGPRATPTVFKDKVYSVGATGIFNCLDARTGKRLWSHDTLVEEKTGNIMWGKANSPLIVEQENGPTLVTVSVGAESGSLIAYNAESGEKVWSAGNRRSSYATPVLAEIFGEPLVITVNEDAVVAHHVADGEIVWEHEWLGNSDSDATVSQPIPLSGDKIFLSKGYGVGSSLLQLSKDDDGKIIAEPLWNQPIRKVMKTKMGNIVLRDGYVYGLDGGILQCIDLEEGRNQWKKRRLPEIGHGQIMLVGETIVILSESGELILVEATPDEYRELAAMRVFPEGEVTWNNPAFSAPYLLLRNGQQAVCLEMPLKDAGVASLP